MLPPFACPRARPRSTKAIVLTVLTFTSLSCVTRPVAAETTSQEKLDPPKLSNRFLLTGTAVLVGHMASGARLEVEIDGNRAEIVAFEYDGNEFAVRLAQPLRTDQRVRLMSKLDSMQSEWSPAFVVQTAILDARHNTECSIYLGADLQTLSGSGEGHGANAAEILAGLQADFRLAGRLEQTTRREFLALDPILRFAVETSYETRIKQFPNREIDQDRVRSLRGIGASFGPRYEFLSIRAKPGHLMVFAKFEATLFFLPTSDGNVEDSLFYGAGLVSTTGPFRDSFVEIGAGRTTLFTQNVNKRFKVNGALIIQTYRQLKAFARVSLDTDLTTGADSFRVVFGLKFEVAPMEQLPN